MFIITITIYQYSYYGTELYYEVRNKKKERRPFFAIHYLNLVIISLILQYSVSHDALVFFYRVILFRRPYIWEIGIIMI